jgi:hypothetical protein
VLLFASLAADRSGRLSRFLGRDALHVQGSKILDWGNADCHGDRVQAFTLTVSGLSDANTMRAVRDMLDHPGDPEAESRLCAALALCRSAKSTEGVAQFKLTPIQRV